MEKTCLSRLFGRCKNCQRDYEPITPAHPVNNYSCRDYYEVHFGKCEVIDESQKYEIKKD